MVNLMLYDRSCHSSTQNPAKVSTSFRPKAKILPVVYTTYMRGSLSPLWYSLYYSGPWFTQPWLHWLCCAFNMPSLFTPCGFCTGLLRLESSPPDIPMVKSLTSVKILLRYYPLSGPTWPQFLKLQPSSPLVPSTTEPPYPASAPHSPHP